ncbi:MAG: isoleucine--tRNA ligase [bacterium]|nr:isoleucine--tRNA ligase [bacterium]
MSEQQTESGRPNFPEMEKEISVFWEKKRIFERSIEERPEKKSYVFYDGPPFATGLPHYGHLLQSAIKDAVPRYWTMKGYRVPRRWGWDCHGLPIENLVEKELGVNSKKDIEAMGIGKFNEACRSMVLRYSEDWREYVKRIGRWVDFDNAYKTMDNNYIESVWWVFSELWKKKMIYKDLRVSLFCPRCSTPLSNFEIAMDNSYEDHEAPAVTVKFKVKGEENTFFLAWTTTPWTLPANTGIAVNPEVMYVKVKLPNGERIIFAKARMNDVLEEHYPLQEGTPAPFEVVLRIKGSDLEGMEYEPLYSFVETTEPAFRVVLADYVSDEDGTGMVHTAPAFGEEDFLTAKSCGLPVLLTIDDEGRQKPENGPFAGMAINEANDAVVSDLKSRGLIYRAQMITHSVPICWRCSTQLLYKAQPAWYVDVTAMKKKMMQTAKKVNWHPEHFKDGRFGKGIESAPDWCISRTRFWGAPLPVWVCEGCDEKRVIGSIAELRDATAKSVKSNLDLHRPSIDDVTLTCTCGKKMYRVADVFDCWFESGSMPYASQHYPYENKKWFDANFPADFIAEAQDQTRGWFYSLHVLATGLFGKPAFTDVIATGLVMAEDGKKMSKKLKNYPDPLELMNELGADSIRFYLLSSSVIRAEQLNFSKKDCQVIQRSVLGTLWNVRAFYLLYAKGRDVEIEKLRSSHVLDRWMFSRLHETSSKMTKAMDGYDLVEATRLLRPFIDDLSTWWLRRSRERIKSESEYESMDALQTLREVLLETSKLLAPFMPFFAERLYQDLEGVKMSVHLDQWPKSDARFIDEPLLEDMQWARDIVRAVLEVRSAEKIPVRQALGKLTIISRNGAKVTRVRESREEIVRLMKEELNILDIELRADEAQTEEWKIDLDTVLTPELRRMGYARELTRHVMQQRKTIGMTPQDRVVVTVVVSDSEMRAELQAVQEEVQRAVNADVFEIFESNPNTEMEMEEAKIGDTAIEIGVRLP